MIPEELEARILRLYHAEKWRVGTIASQVGVHHSTVQRVLARAGLPDAAASPRRSLIDPYRDVIKDTLSSYPQLPASRLYEMIRERGYAGGPDHFRHLIALIRPRKAPEAYLRLRTLPGEQGQVDWGHFGKLTIGRAQRPLMAFVMVLSWSRRVFLRFFLNQQMENFLRGHEAAFMAWSGVPRILLYDNLKSAVLERRGAAIRFHPTLLSFAGHYRYQPRPVAVARGNEKGRVERAIRYIRSSFFPARKYRDLDDLNEQARQWCEGLSSDRRCPEDRTMTVREAYEQEQGKLLSLPSDTFPTDERVEVKVGKTPYVRFDSNDYSVPHTLTRKLLVVRADEQQLRILDGVEVIATHRRSYDKGAQIECPEHIEALVKRKREASQHRGMDYLRHAVPQSAPLLEQMAQRGANLGAAVNALKRLLEQHTAEQLNSAIAEALEQEAPSPPSVRLILERREQARGKKPAVSMKLSAEAQACDVAVRPHALNTYDTLGKEETDE